MPTLEHLKVKPGWIIRSATWNAIVDELQEVVEGRIPYIYAYYGYFAYGLWVAGKAVLKDGDPIIVAEDLTTKPILLGFKRGFAAASDTDIFDADLEVEKDGRVRFKFTANADVKAKVKWIPYQNGYAIIAALKDGALISADTWQEEDFTVKQYDKVNFRIVPGATITIYIYNIGSA